MTSSNSYPRISDTPVLIIAFPPVFTVKHCKLQNI